MILTTDKTTMVMLYNHKAKHLVDFIYSLQTIATTTFGRKFIAKPVSDIHATLIGLESAHITQDQFDALIAHTRNTFDRPMSIRFGGLEEGKDYAFRSRNQQLFHRQISVIYPFIVLIGWPVHDSQPVPWLEEFRRECQQYGVTHKYHKTSSDIDPDCYMVIGSLTVPMSDDVEQSFIQRARVFLSQNPLTVNVGKSDVKVVNYKDVSLPISSTDIISDLKRYSRLERHTLSTPLDTEVVDVDPAGRDERHRDLHRSF